MTQAESTLPGDHRIRLSRQERVDPGQAKVPTAIAAPSGDLFTLYDGEGRIDVANVVAALRRVGLVEDAVENEVERIQHGPQHQATVFAPNEGRQNRATLIDMAQIASEGRKVVSGVAEFQNGFANDVAG